MVSNIIDLSYNLSKYIQFEVACLHRYTVLILYRLGRKGKLLKFLRILIKAVYFKDRNWIAKTAYCISCSVICKIVFYSEFPDIPDNTGRKREDEEEEHKQLQSVMRFTQTQKMKNAELCYLHSPSTSNPEGHQCSLICTTTQNYVSITNMLPQ